MGFSNYSACLVVLDVVICFREFESMRSGLYQIGVLILSTPLDIVVISGGFNNSSG